MTVPGVGALVAVALPLAALMAIGATLAPAVAPEADGAMARAPGTLTDKWSYDTGVVLRAMLGVWQKSKEPKYFEYVKRTIDGRVHRCALSAHRLREATAWLERYRVVWDDTLARLAEFVEDRDG